MKPLHSIVKIDGIREFICRVDSRGLIVKVTPHNNHLINRKIGDVFEEGRKVAKFTFLGTDDPDMIVGDDVLNRMIEINPALGTLVTMFDCEIL